jgi:hypothetical protein
MLPLAAACNSSKQKVPMPNLEEAISDDAKSRVYVFRSGQVYGWLQDLTVYEGEQKIGVLVPGNFFCWETTPGRKIIRVVADRPEFDSAWREGIFDLQAAGGDVHHVGVRFRQTDGKPQLSEWEDAEGDKRVAELEPAKVKL